MIVSGSKGNKYIWPDGAVTYIQEPVIKPVKRIRDKIKKAIKKYRAER